MNSAKIRKQKMQLINWNQDSVSDYWYEIQAMIEILSRTETLLDLVNLKVKADQTVLVYIFKKWQNK